MSKHTLLERFYLEDSFSKRREIITQRNGVISQKARILNYVAARMWKGFLAEIFNIFTLAFASTFTQRGRNQGEKNKIILAFVKFYISLVY